MNDVIEVEILPSQADLHIVNPKVAYVLWQRAGGKTSGGIAPRIDHLNRVMPKSQILLVTDTYDRLTDRIVPGITTFLENKMGYKEDVDFVKYKKPPSTFEKPYMKLDKYDHVISFADGMALCLVSLKVQGSANAFSAQAAIIDEAKFCDEQQVNSEVVPALRGMEDLYIHLPEYRSTWFFSDKFGPKIKWLLAKKKMMNRNWVEVVRTLQWEIFSLEQKLEDADSEAMQNHYLYKIEELKGKVRPIQKAMIFYSDMPEKENEPIVTKEYFRDMKRIMKKYEYEVSILNKDPDKIENTFYPMLSSTNMYSADDDIDVTKPLIVAFDYNYRIVPIVVAQVGKLGDSPYTTLNIVRSYHQLFPDASLLSMVKEFCYIHSHQVVKHVYYVHDHTAIGRNPIGTTFKSIVVDAFLAEGWYVTEVYIGQAQEHDIKFENLKEHLSNNAELAIRINEQHNEYLIKSMEQAPAVISQGKTKKEKKTEADQNFPAEESTHYSDAFDMIPRAVLELKLITPTEAMPASIVTK
jgi:hypothetical protein